MSYVELQSNEASFYVLASNYESEQMNITLIKARKHKNIMIRSYYCIHCICFKLSSDRKLKMLQITGERWSHSTAVKCNIAEEEHLPCYVILKTINGIHEITL